MDRREASGVDHRQVGIVLAAAFGDLPAVDLTGQSDVGDQHIRHPPLAPRQRFFPVARVDHVVAFFAQCFDDRFPNKRVVLDQKNSHQGSSMPPHLILVGNCALLTQFRSFGGKRSAHSQIGEVQARPSRES